MSNGINFNPAARSVNAASDIRKEADVKANRAQDKEKEVAPKQDGWDVKEKQSAPVTYSRIEASKKTSASEIEGLRSKANQANENLRQLVEQLILKQTKGYKVAASAGEGEKQNILPNGAISEIEKAQQAVSENGEWGVKAVSDRLVNFAISVSGGDKSKLEGLVAAIDKGFAAARDAWGGELPEISQKTYQETMRKLEAWAKGTETE